MGLGGEDGRKVAWVGEGSWWVGKAGGKLHRTYVGCNPELGIWGSVGCVCVVLFSLSLNLIPAFCQPLSSTYTAQHHPYLSPLLTWNNESLSDFPGRGRKKEAEGGELGGVEGSRGRLGDCSPR